MTWGPLSSHICHGERKPSWAQRTAALGSERGSSRKRDFSTSGRAWLFRYRPSKGLSDSTWEMSALPEDEAGLNLVTLWNP